jgi:PTS system nitrogen regulatory IIA component
MHLSVNDVARLLQITQETVYKWIDRGKLPAYPVDDQYRFNRAELLEWATAEGIPVAPDAFEEVVSDEPLPSLAEALRAGGIFHGVPGADKRAVLTAAVDRLALPASVDRESLLAVLLAREALGSTGVGGGIAIPHVRNPIVLHFSQPAVALCFLAEPIDFGAIDGQPVHTMFLITTPTIRVHLHLLARLGHALRDPHLQELLGARASGDEIVSLVQRLEGSLPARPGSRRP